mmetsp:Transcript_69379/g.206655  ORF Transcript_69379/g.206655 Transcript_69379/m.206655 type:complete len:207 (-) Transcript_69379:250-870(-)
MHRELPGAVGLQGLVKVQIDVADIRSTYSCHVHRPVPPCPGEHNPLVDAEDVVHPPQDAATYRQQLAREMPALCDRAPARRVHLVVVAGAQVDDGVAEDHVGVLCLHRVVAEEPSHGVRGPLHLLHPRIGPVDDAGGEQSAVDRAYEACRQRCDGPGALLQSPAEEVGERREGVQGLAHLLEAAAADPGIESVGGCPQARWKGRLC